VTEDTSVTSASVAWTISGTYDATNKAASTVQYNGVVTLPATVDANNVALTTTITVNVKEAGKEPASAPLANLAEGTYETAQNVALSTTEANATIYYTTDGSDPTTESAKYEGPIAVSETTTIKAITVVEGKENSPVASFTYTIASSTPENPSDPSEPSDPTNPDNPSNPSAPEKESQTITTSKDSYKSVYSDSKKISLGAEAKTALTYSSDNESVVTVNKNGKAVIKGVGTANITITAAETDVYNAATKVVTVTIKPAVVTSVLVNSKKAAKMTIAYESVTGVTGYQIQYSTNKNFKPAKTTQVNVKSKKTSKTIKGLTSGKTYYVRVRGVKGDIVGGWSAKKSVKVK
jgi:hypothetical protein